jgi:hypothetical protein
MTQARVSELATLLARPPCRVAPTVEDGLRVAAGTLGHVSPDLIMSTTLVVDIGPDDLEALTQVVSEIADTYDLEAEVNPHVGWCAVRFSRRKRTAR